jgi:hypothetical protein
MPPADKVTMTQQELKELVSEAVTETLTKLGVDTTNPVEMQRDFQHLREWRQTTSSLKRHGMLTLLGIFIAGAVAALWLGFQSAFHK